MRRRAPVCPAPVLDAAILAALADSEVPLSAYDVISVLDRGGRRMAPMSVYRALDRMCARRQIQKVEMVSAYRVRSENPGALLVCTSCGRATALPMATLHEELNGAVVAAGFAPSVTAVEVAGQCAECRQRN